MDYVSLIEKKKKIRKLIFIDHDSFSLFLMAFVEALVEWIFFTGRMGADLTDN